MRSFSNNQRVQVVSPVDPSENALRGKVGTVVRLRTDGAAWIAMDEEVPSELRKFPAGDSRTNHVLMYPEECREA